MSIVWMSVDALAVSCLTNEERKGLGVGCHIRCGAVGADAVICERSLWMKHVSSKMNSVDDI